jgi:flagellin-specific chaperone FliS
MAKEIDKKQEAIVEEYIKQVERCRHADEQEKNVEKFETYNDEKDNITKIIENINKLNHHLNYYSGGLVALASCLNDGMFLSTSIIR